ncbi:hypothetical protein [Burkholderia latens]|uniref:hypothetical protein n=1 Tax=Burkholderia latens TaxID=488446 RepID=UPI000B24DF45|nr:hypothetical protein [Burkholderia latens]
MALLAIRPISEAWLSVRDDELNLDENHIFEPEYHQDLYAGACVSAAEARGAYQVGMAPGLIYGPVRGTQPAYADDENDLDSLEWEGMVTANGSVLDSAKSTRNICALKSASVRRGYVDFSLARSVTREFHAKKKKANILPNDVLINSTGDGTIGRVAVFNGNFPALVDGHITILRFENPDDAWYTAAFLLSDLGQRQIYRYINGSSGQVEIYPQDIARIWVKPAKSEKHKAKVAEGLRAAASLHADFYRKLQVALSDV